MQATEIQWTEKTWNPVRGCTRVSEGCTRCYAERQAARYSGPGLPFEGFAVNTPAGPRWTGKVELIPEKLGEPLRMRKPAMIFTNSMSDLFHEGLSNEDIAAVFGVMAACPQHTFQVLTKRPARMLEWFGWLERAAAVAKRDLFQSDGLDWTRQHVMRAATLRTGMAFPRGRSHIGMDAPWPLPNVWLGVSCEDQATADERIPLLLQCPAAVRWVSAEPLLGPVDLARWVAGGRTMHMSANVEGALRNRSFSGLISDDGRELSEAEAEAQLRELQRHGVRLIAANGCDNFDPETGCRGHAYPRLDWVVVGGESGPGARPMHPAWAEQIRDACVAASVPYFFKQWGGHAPACRNFIGAFWMDHDGTRASCHVHPSGPGGFGLAPDGTARQWVCMSPSNKREPGRLLDGRTWDEMPARAEA